MKCDIAPDSTICVSQNHPAREVGSETCILEKTKGVIFSVEHVAEHIWRLIQKPIKVGKLCEQLTRDYDVPEKRCREDVLHFLTTLEKEGLVTIRPEIVQQKH